MLHLLQTRAEARSRIIHRCVQGIGGIVVAAVLITTWSPQTSLAHVATTSPSSTTTRYDWTQFGGNAAHSLNNTAETTLTAANVRGLTKLFRVTLPNTADGAGVYAADVTINTVVATGVHDVVFYNTSAGDLVALDAHTGMTLWSHQYGPNGCTINNGSTPCYTASQPAIDPNKLYVYSYGLDGKVHKYLIETGAEVMTGGWPEVTTLKLADEKNSGDLTIATDASNTTYLYSVNGGNNGDQGDYQGHVTGVNLATGAQNVFNVNCSEQTVHFVKNPGPGQSDCSQVQSAIWSREGVAYSAATDKIYMATGNGPYIPNMTGRSWGDSILALRPDATGTMTGPIDAYTPSNYASLRSSDADLGSTGPALLPAIAGSNVPHVGLQSGKDAMLRLVNLDDLSGHGAAGYTGGELFLTGVPQGREVLTQPAVWTNPSDNSVWTFVTNDSGISGLKVVSVNGSPRLQTVWTKNSNAGGSSPLIANNVLYYAGSNRIQALDPTTGNLLWQDTTIGGIHWASPIVANGVLYISDSSKQVTAYSLPSTGTMGTPTSAASTNTPTSVPPTGTATKISATSTATTGPSTSTPTNVPATMTPTKAAATSTPTTATATKIPTTTPTAATSTPTPTNVPSATNAPSATTIPTSSATSTQTTTPTATVTVSPTLTSTATQTPTTMTTATQTLTTMPTATPTATIRPTSTATTAPLATKTVAPTATPTARASACTGLPSLRGVAPATLVYNGSHVLVTVRTLPGTNVTVSAAVKNLKGSRVLYQKTATTTAGYSGSARVRITLIHHFARFQLGILDIKAKTVCGTARQLSLALILPF